MQGQWHQSIHCHYLLAHFWQLQCQNRFLFLWLHSNQIRHYQLIWAPYYLIFKTAILKVKLPVGFPIKQMAQFCVASVPLTPWVTIYCHPIRSSAWIEMIMYSVALICKSYSFFSDSAVIVLVKNSIPGRLLFYVEHDNIEFCIYQSITSIVFCHDKSIRFVRI